jgi:hypothetical protein
VLPGKSPGKSSVRLHIPPVEFCAIHANIRQSAAQLIISPANSFHSRAFTSRAGGYYLNLEEMRMSNNPNQNQNPGQQTNSPGPGQQQQGGGQKPGQQQQGGQKPDQQGGQHKPGQGGQDR